MEYTGPRLSDSLIGAMRALILLTKDTSLEWGFTFTPSSKSVKVLRGTSDLVNLPTVLSGYSFHTHPPEEWELTEMFSPSDIQTASNEMGSFLGFSKGKTLMIKYLSGRAFRPEDTRKIIAKDEQLIAQIKETRETADMYRQRRLEFFKRLDTKAAIVSVMRV